MSTYDFERFFDLSLELLCIARAEGYFVRVNPSFSRVLGWSADELAGRPFLEFVHPDDVQGTAREFERNVAGAPTLTFENRFRCLDGAYRHVQWTARQDPDTGLVFAVGRDTTDASATLAALNAALERERGMLDALRQSEERLRQAVRVSRIGIFDHDHATNTIYWSPVQRATFGWGLDEPVTLDKFLAQVHPDDRPAIADAVRRAHDPAGDGLFDVEHRITRRDGAVRVISTRSQTFFEGEGAARHLARTVGAVIDITDRRRVEEAMQMKDAAIATSINAIAITDSDGRVSYVNPAFVRLWGYDHEGEVIGRTPLDFAEPESTERVLTAIRERGSWQGELIARRKDGSTFTILLSASAVMDAQGRLHYMMASFLDVSEARRMEEQLRHAQRMESVGRLAGGVAHDFNNLLTVMKGYLELAEQGIAPDDPRGHYLAAVGRAADSAAMLTQQLLAFSRRQVIDPRSLSLNDVVAGTEHMLRRLLGEDIDLQTVLASDLSTVRFDPGQAEQILFNLAVNARDAMPEGGKLTIETANVVLDEDYLRRHPHVEPGDYVMLAVSDNGAGMSQEVLAHLFEPFFTTKPIGKGTGLGLSMVYGAVKQNGGNVEAYSELGHGTTLKIYLPRIAGVSAPLRVPAVRGLPGGTETVFVVEDDDHVRELARLLLKRQGYAVSTFGSAPAALQAADGHPGPLHLLVTDVILPGMNGRTLAEEMVRLRPGVKVLFTSGYTANVIAHHGVLEPGIEFLAKPYSMEAFARRVREVLDKPVQ